MGKLYEALRPIFRNPVPSDPSFYLNLLQMCIDAKAGKEGRLIHKYLFFNGIDSNVTLNNKMIIFYGKIGDMKHARKVFDKMPERNIVSWTALVSGYSQNGFFKDALMVFESMHYSGVKGNQFTFGSALRACTKLMCLRSGKQTQGCLQKSRFAGNLFVQSALVDLHSKCGRIEDASIVFQMMSERDLVCWNAMIGGFAVQGYVNDAFRMFWSMMKEGKIPDCFTFGSLLNACAQGNNPSRVFQIHGLIVQHGFGLHELLSRLLIDAYAKCGSTKYAYSVFRSMMVKDLVSYTAMIAGFALDNDHHIDALNLFGEIYHSGMVLDGFILCTMLSMCSNSSLLNFGRQIHALALKYVPTHDVVMGNALIDMYAKCGELKEAICAFDQMEEKNVISWSSLIDGYAKHGYGHEAMSLYRKMEYEGLKPNDVTFLSLLFACSHAGLIREGWECFNNMVGKHNIAPTEKHYSCMIDVLARGGQLEEAFVIMQKMDIQPNKLHWGAILGASNVHGDISLGKLAANHLFNLDTKNSSNYVALANIYAASGLWNDSWGTHKLMEKHKLKKNPGYSLDFSQKKRT
ncbi:pentatricopeptide repeat-containing protein At3g20730-like [Chenopodium quinoa]|uniref:Pentatricopeptide repeat-containing protein n=1 Tax=Chenopodium quinoa TaxID=63459 RepID=A0A803MZX7_CHEQI|nr:pentatricopeptide repeat-containing protein At3g20730-like [Chenopodium quinoa]XP_021735585.1 pentatricopeptide repeat-containing protein At3g20730-like [Chenopodium quinoa]XP_021735586.1 pentatricopeptide repeat-containing protein At3g20730-like [Chenopodium quinoa]XP_021735587.1 pentatricopeptide repeat-containing protein At3g20730-like [Chenopodium quinoa]